MSKPPVLPPAIPREHAAEALGLSKQRIHQLVREGRLIEIPGSKPRSVTLESVEAFQAAREAADPDAVVRHLRALSDKIDRLTAEIEHRKADRDSALAMLRQAERVARKKGNALVEAVASHLLKRHAPENE